MENDRKLHFTLPTTILMLWTLKVTGLLFACVGPGGNFLKEAEGFTITYLGDGITSHMLELTWLKDFDCPRYNLGDNEVHLAMKVKGHGRCT